MKRWVYFLLVVLSISLATAINIDIPLTEYTANDLINIAITDCPGEATLRVFNPEPQLIQNDQGIADWTSLYAVSSDSSAGKYEIKVNCVDATEASVYFCVDDPGCLDTTSANTGNPGGSTSCTSDWTCSAWGLCNSTLQQGRTCYDNNGCASSYHEDRTCTDCSESWVCSSWSTCSSTNQNRRTCVEEHYCGTSLLKPALSKSCSDTSTPPPQPARISSTLVPPSVTAPAPPQTQQPEAGFMEQFGLLVIGVPIIIVVILLGVFLYLHFHGKADNHDEAKGWVAEARMKGTSDEEIKQQLSDSGWKKHDIKKVMK
jgi:hypothetical protein